MLEEQHSFCDQPVQIRNAVSCLVGMSNLACHAYQTLVEQKLLVLRFCPHSDRFVARGGDDPKRTCNHAPHLRERSRSQRRSVCMVCMKMQCSSHIFLVPAKLRAQVEILSALHAFKKNGASRCLFRKCRGASQMRCALCVRPQAVPTIEAA